MSAFQRARQPEQREARRAEIVATARRIATSDGAIKLTISELGRQAALSKASIYRYFESLEHVLLLILVAELDELSRVLCEKLDRPSLTHKTIAAHLAAAYQTRPLLCQLLGTVSSILEHNLSADAIAEAKLEIKRASDLLNEALARAVSGLTLADAQWVSHSIALYVGGAWPAAHPSKAAAEVLARPQFGGFQPDLAADLSRFVQVLLSGVALVPRPRPRPRKK